VTRLLRPILVLITGFWCIAIVVAPLLNSLPLYAFFSFICHQLSDRSWHINGEPLGVCIRCTSISFGFLFGLILGGRPRATWFKWALAISIGEWLILDLEVLRALSGIALGLTGAPIVSAGVEEMFTARIRTVHESM
jgi:hypothetical protein